MTAIAVDIADAVATEMNTGDFSIEFTAVRAYRPQAKLHDDLAALCVFVVPTAKTILPMGRHASTEDYVVDVAVMKKVADLSNATIDPLMALVEEIAEFFKHRKLTAYPAATWAGTENEPIFVPEHMDEFGQFTSILRLTFKVPRSGT